MVMINSCHTASNSKSYHQHSDSNKQPQLCQASVVAVSDPWPRTPPVWLVARTRHHPRSTNRRFRRFQVPMSPRWKASRPISMPLSQETCACVWTYTLQQVTASSHIMRMIQHGTTNPLGCQISCALRPGFVLLSRSVIGYLSRVHQDIHRTKFAVEFTDLPTVAKN